MNNTLSNGFKVLEYMSGTAEAHSVKEVAKEFGLPDSHACRLLKTLKELGYLEQEAGTRKYRVSLRILCLSNACLSRLGIRNRLRPFLNKLTIELGEATFLTVPFDSGALIVDVLYSANPGDITLTIGTINPAHNSATGKICAAFLPENQIDDCIANIEFTQVAERTITDAKTYKKALLKVRKEKIATTDSERGPGVAAVAAPVFNCNGELAAAIGVTLPGKKHSEKQWAHFIERTRECAENCSFALGYALNELNPNHP